MRNVVIVEAVRTGFGKIGGSLRQFGMSQLAAFAIDGLLKKHNSQKKAVRLTACTWAAPCTIIRPTVPHVWLACVPSWDTKCGQAM